MSSLPEIYKCKHFFQIEHTVSNDSYVVPNAAPN